MGMRRMDIRLVYALVGVFILFIMPLSYANGSNFLRTQGLINPGGNVKSGYLFINEMKVYIDEKTQIMDYHQSPIPAAELKPKRWVYMDLEKDRTRKMMVKARKIYLLPHYLNEEQKRRFPFVK